MSQSQNDRDELSLADLAQLGEIWQRHRKELVEMVSRRIDSRLNSAIGAEDVVNQAFLRARRRWLHVRDMDESRHRAWLFRIVRDTLFEQWRNETRQKRDVERRMPFPDRSSAALGMKLANSVTPSRIASAKEESERVTAAIQRLTDEDRELLWMRHYDQLRFAEIAVVLDVTENAATLRYTRALRKLKQELL